MVGYRTARSLSIGVGNNYIKYNVSTGKFEIYKDGSKIWELDGDLKITGDFSAGETF